MQVKRLAVEDTAIAITVIKLLKLHNPTGLTVDMMTEFLGSTERYLITALDDASPVGFLLAYELARVDRIRPMMLLYEVEVAESHQRQGVGTAMVNLLKEFCQHRNVYKIWVQTSKSNVAAKNLYEATGATLLEGGDCLTFTYDLNGEGN